MLGFTPLFLLALGASQSLSYAQSSPRPLKYEEPTVLTATIYAKDAGPRKVLYRLKRTATRSGRKVSVVREFTYPDGKPAARERAVYEGDEMVSYALEELQIGAAGSATIQREAGNPAKSVLLFEYTKDLGAGGKAKTSTEVLRNDTLTSDMVAPFLATHWAELARAEKVRCRYIVVPQRETVGFTFVKDTETSYQGRKALVLRMEATSPIIARLVDPIYFTVESAAPHRVFQVVGRSTPKVKVGSAWEDLDALTLFDWPAH